MSLQMDLVAGYEKRIAHGHIQPSQAQAQAVDALQETGQQIVAYHAVARGWRSWLSSKMFSSQAQPPPKGLYLWGGVGRGKTMLMDMFYEALPIEAKRRSHFHEFMSEVHDRIGAARKADAGDPIPIVAEQLAKRGSALCFDEFHVTDIADAMILGRLFKALFDRDIVVIATSNVPPRDLYRDGLNRALFVPFIEMLEQRMTVHEVAASKDYRLEKIAGHRLYFTPIDDQAKAEMEALWHGFLCGDTPRPAELDVQGRTITVPASADGVARFTFDDLCDRPLGARDYLVIARHFHTVFVDGIPKLGPAQRNAARRFINLIDTFYDNGVVLIASAQAEPEAIYDSGDGADLFHRTASRLNEMRSAAYLEGRKDRLTLAASKANDPAETV